jgi:hypothetical protein
MPQSAYPANPQVTAPAVSFEAVQGKANHLEPIHTGGAELALDEDRQGRMLNAYAGDILEALRSLPGEYRVAVYLHEIENFSIQEIAEIMGLDLESAHHPVHEGRQQARRSYIRRVIHEWSGLLISCPVVVTTGCPDRPAPCRLRTALPSFKYRPGLRFGS